MKKQNKEGNFFCLENFGLPQFIACALSGLLIFQSVSPAWAQKFPKRLPKKFPMSRTTLKQLRFNSSLERAALRNYTHQQFPNWKISEFEAYPQIATTLQLPTEGATPLTTPPAALIPADMKTQMDAIFKQIQNENAGNTQTQELVNIYKRTQALIHQDTPQARAEIDRVLKKAQESLARVEVTPENEAWVQDTQEALNLAEEALAGKEIPTTKLQELQTKARKILNQLTARNLVRYGPTAALLTLLIKELVTKTQTPLEEAEVAFYSAAISAVLLADCGLTSMKLAWERDSEVLDDIGTILILAAVTCAVFTFLFYLDLKEEKQRQEETEHDN